VLYDVLSRSAWADMVCMHRCLAESARISQWRIPPPLSQNTGRQNLMPCTKSAWP
jgi:hypothetical protein